MNGQPAAIAYVRADDGTYAAVCMTVLSTNHDGLVNDLTVFVHSEYLEKWGYPARLAAAK